MTTDEYLLVTLIEECAEVQQAATKILRFGNDSSNPKLPFCVDNLAHIKNELHDLRVVLEMLDTSKKLRCRYDEDKLAVRRNKKLHYMEVSRTFGRIKDG